MRTEAERKAQQRQGIKNYWVPLHTKTAVATLVAEGLLPEADMENDAAIGEAVARAFNSRPRFLQDETYTIKQRQTYKPKRREKPRHGPCRTLSESEKAHIVVQENRRRMVAEKQRQQELENQREREAAAEKWEREAFSLRQRRIDLWEEKQRHDADVLRRKIAAAPAQAKKERAWDSLGSKSGIKKKGGKPVPNGFWPHTLEEKPSRQCRADKAAVVRRAQKP